MTGASAGVGKELAQILYSHNAKVYVAARSEERSKTAIESIKAAFPNAQGQLVYLHLDLADLSTIKKSANDFLAKETRLDVLFNNAGVMVPPQGSKTKQGYELQLGTNNLGPFLFTKLLTPVLLRTAASKDLSPGDVRIVWVSSSAAELMAPKGGIIMENLDYRVDKRAGYKYGVSKAGNVYHATEYSKRYGSDGILSVVSGASTPVTKAMTNELFSKALNPGNLKSDLGRHLSWLETLLISFLVHTPIHGAYTELFAGLSPEVTPAHNGTWSKLLRHTMPFFLIWLTQTL